MAILRFVNLICWEEMLEEARLRMEVGRARRNALFWRTYYYKVICKINLPKRGIKRGFMKVKSLQAARGFLLDARTQQAL